jgi:hypothetical protein
MGEWTASTETQRVCEVLPFQGDTPALSVSLNSPRGCTSVSADEAAVAAARRVSKSLGKQATFKESLNKYERAEAAYDRQQNASGKVRDRLVFLALAPISWEGG